MGLIVRHIAELRTRLIVASGIALLLALPAASPVAAAAADGNLSKPSASPSPAVVGQTVTFSVTYTDPANTPLSSARVYIDGASKTLTLVSGAIPTGAVYRYTWTATVGTHAYYFRFRDQNGALGCYPVSTPTPCTTTSALTVNPAPTPKPVATPTPAPTAVPTPAPTAVPTPAPTPVKTAAPTARKTAAPTRKITPAPTVAPAATPSPIPVDPNAGANGLAGQPTPTAILVSGADESPAPTTGTSTGPSGSHSPSAAAVAGGLTNGGAGNSGSGDPAGPSDMPGKVLPAAAAIGGAVVLCSGAWFFFLLLSRRRRNRRESVPSVRLSEPVLAAVGVTTAEPLEPRVDESLMPRWRRPSLQAVRKTDPNRAVSTAVTTLSFDTAGPIAANPSERRRIGYRLVRLMSVPDEIRATEVGTLDKGDEVLLLDRQGVYCLVLCPDGRQGWIHKMTLEEEPITEAAAVVPADAEPMPQYGFEADEVPAESHAEEEILDVYMNARREILRSADQAAAEEGFETPELFGAASEVDAPAETVLSAPEDDGTRGLLEAYLNARSETQADGQIEAPELPVEADLTSAEAPPPDAPVPAVAPVAARKPRASSSRSKAKTPVTSSSKSMTVAAPSVTSSEPAPVASPEHADGQYSGRKRAGTRKGASDSPPGTKSRRP